MNKPIEDLELTAMIDGELDELRAAEIRAAMTRDPALRARLEAMRSADSAWTAAAATARFKPAVHLQPAPRHSSPASVVPILAAVLLAIARMALKLMEPGFAIGMLLHALMLIVALAFVVAVWWTAKTPLQPSPAPAHA